MNQGAGYTVTVNSTREFFLKWLELIKPLHNLSDKEMGVAASFLQIRYEKQDKVVDDEVMGIFLKSREAISRILEENELKQNNFYVIQNKLRAIGFIDKFYVIANPYIPNIVNIEEPFYLQFKIHVTKESIQQSSEETQDN